MVVHHIIPSKINSKGIKETIGAGKRFQTLPKKIKMYKIATIRCLKQIIETANLMEDDVPNYHTDGIYTFAYLENEILVDEEVLEIRISIMKRIDSNWFWIHHIDEKEKSSKLLDPTRETELKEI